MAVAGVPPLVFAVVALIDLLYQYWVHTQQIGRLGWFDRWFCAPSNHRVHHAVNDRYLDRNYGGILIVWDRLFGTFIEEDEAEACVYGTRSPLRSWNPLWANLQVYWELAKDSWHAASWADKLRVWSKPPGWRPADVAARWPKPAFDIGAAQRFDPPLPPRAAWLAGGLFSVGATSARFAKWDGRQWTILPFPLEFWIAKITPFDDGLGPGIAAVGSMTSLNGQPARGFAERRSSPAWMA